jgi:NTP pyrophosphatase (non-canonical NTP hydrolase)
MLKTFEEYEGIISETAIYPDVGKGSSMALSYAALGLTGESGEYAEKVKKYIRDGVFDKRLAAKELGDVLWYLTASARELGYSLQDIAEMNAVKLLERKRLGMLQGNGDEREVSKEQS